MSNVKGQMSSILEQKVFVLEHPQAFEKLKTFFSSFVFIFFLGCVSRDSCGVSKLVQVLIKLVHVG